MAVLIDLSALPLVDGHCHPVVAGPVEDFELWCTESAVGAPPGTSHLDSHIGHLVRRWCPPALGLPAHASLVDYLTARGQLPPAVVTERLLRAANLSTLLVDSGLPDAGMLTLPALAEAAAAPVAEIVRLETLAERVSDSATAHGFADAYRGALATALAGNVVGTKSILAYRHGLDIEPDRPTAAEVTAAADRWLRARVARPARLTDPVLLRFLLWSAVDTGRPVQLHTGFGDADAAIRRADPGLLQPFCAATQDMGTPLVLLHCYPFHRQAGWLAHLYPHVYVDVGLTVNYVGARSSAVLAEFLELAPFGKVLYSSDAYGLPELYLTGAAQFRHALASVLTGFVDDGAMTSADATRVALGIAAHNAHRLYYGLTSRDDSRATLG